MNYRMLGRSDIQVSPLGMGCWAIGGEWTMRGNQAGWGEVDDAESIRAIHAALDSGITFFDTAANYGTGHSEDIVGKALAGKRDQVIIATKFGFDVNETDKVVVPYAEEMQIIENVRAECERSLRHLNIDTIDLYQLHVWNFSVELMPHLHDALEALVREGKIRYYGWSTNNADASRVFAQGEHCVAIQHDLNVVKRAPGLIDLCEELNLASVNRTPLARGALTGKYTPDSAFAETDIRSSPNTRENYFMPVLEKLDDLRDILTSGGRTLAQGALAWIWARSETTVPIPGIRTVQQATENAGAMDFGPLTADQMRQIDEILGIPVS